MTIQLGDVLVPVLVAIAVRCAIAFLLPRVPGWLAGASRLFNLGEIALDVAAVVGAALICFAAHMAYRPAGYFSAGAFLLAGAWLSARRREA